MKSKGGNSNARLIIIIGVVMLAVLVAGLVLILQALNRETPAPIGVGGVSNPGWVVNEDNLESIQDAMAKQVQEGYFETEMNTVWSFPTSAESSTDAHVGNSASNLFPMYFTVTLDDTGELVYTSSLIPVGSLVKTLTLDTAIPAGSYAATCTFYPIDDTQENPEDQAKGAVNVGVTINVHQ